MGIHRLTVHPQSPTASVRSVDAQIGDLSSSLLTVEFAVRSTAPLLLPDPGPSKRLDGLWQSTCFEVFLRPGGAEKYFEYNFAPSTAWAAYSFEGYREGRRDQPMLLDPDIWLSSLGEWFWLWAKFEISRPGKAGDTMGLSAIIEEADGTKSYWALAHPPGDPDFHHPDCFALELPAPEQP